MLAPLLDLAKILNNRERCVISKVHYLPTLDANLDVVGIGGDGFEMELPSKVSEQIGDVSWVGRFHDGLMNGA